MSHAHAIERDGNNKQVAVRGKSLSRRHKPIEGVIQELMGKVPKKEWEKLPPDLPGNLDHYLYGWSK